MNENNNVEQSIHVTKKACRDGLFNPDENGKVVIPDTYTGQIFCQAFPGVVYKDEKAIKDFVANNITAIQTHAFFGNDTLTSISFPNVTLVEGEAFVYCDNLVNVDLPNVTKMYYGAFYGCKSIKTLDLPKLETISPDTFSGMISLETINIPSLNNIPNSDDLKIFRECPQLEEIRVGTDEMAQYLLDHLDPSCMKAKVYVRSSDVPIGESPSKYSDEYQDIDIKKANELLDSENFKDGALIIPENFNGRIINEAFEDNESIKSINTNNISTICKEAFKYCTELTEAFGNNVTKIEQSAFFSCENLNKVDFPNVDELCLCAFMHCKNLTEVNIPNVTKIGSGCFSECESLIQIENLKNVCELKFDAFEGCKKLQQIDLPLVAEIENTTFNGCTELQQINIPLVTKIGSGAFKECTNLEKISMPKIKELNSNIFDGCENLNEIVTTTAEQCELIFNSMSDTLQKKVKDGECNLLYGEEVWNPQA